MSQATATPALERPVGCPPGASSSASPVAAAEPTSAPRSIGNLTGGAAHWQKASPRYGIPHLRLRQVAALVNEISGRSERPLRLLDIGCSTGFLATLCTNITYSGCDLVPPPADAPPFDFHLCDVNAGLPDALRGYDIIVCCGMLEYVARLGPFLVDLRSRLNPAQGHLIASYFNFNHISRIAAMLRGKNFWTHPDWRGFHSPATFRGIVEQAGFSVEKAVVSTSGLGPSVKVEETVDLPLRLPRTRPWSHLTGHQIVTVAVSVSE